MIIKNTIAAELQQAKYFSVTVWYSSWCGACRPAHIHLLISQIRGAYNCEIHWVSATWELHVQMAKAVVALFFPLCLNTLMEIHFHNINTDTSQRLLTFKSLSDTQWCNCTDSTKPVCQNYSSIQQALEGLSKNINQPPDTCLNAAYLHMKMEQLETAVMELFWTLCFSSSNWSVPSYRRWT